MTIHSVPHSRQPASVIRVFSLALLLTVFAAAIAPAAEPLRSPQWQQIELSFEARATSANPYTDVEAWVDFTHDDSTRIRRPMFWDGGRIFRVRFASSRSDGTWRWQATDPAGDPGLRGEGRLEAVPAIQPQTIFERHGFWRIPKNGRNLLHADGTAAAALCRHALGVAVAGDRRAG